MYSGASPSGCVNILGTGVNTVNMDTASKHIIEAAKKGEQGYVCVTGAHGVLESVRDTDLRRIHNRSLLTVPDGMPNVWLGKLRGIREMGRVYGPNLMAEVFARSECNGMTHFFYGATADTLDKLKARLKTRFPQAKIVGTFAPPFRPLNAEEEVALQRMVTECQPDFFWVGLSTPKQERFMAQHAPASLAEDRSSSAPLIDNRSNELQPNDSQDIQNTSQYPRSTDHNPLPAYQLDTKIMLGVGAAFDFHAGNKADAPQWIKNIGMQWFYRFCSDPCRLWKRYGFIVPSYIFLNLLQATGLKKFPLEK